MNTTTTTSASSAYQQNVYDLSNHLSFTATWLLLLAALVLGAAGFIAAQGRTLRIGRKRAWE